MFLRIQFFP